MEVLLLLKVVLSALEKEINVNNKLNLLQRLHSILTLILLCAIIVCLVPNLCLVVI